MHKFQQKLSGFTLIEAAIVVALVGIVMVVLTQFFLSGNTVTNEQNIQLDINYMGRLAVDDIDNYVRPAMQTLGSYDTYTASSTVLILEIASVNSSNQLVPGTFDRVVFYLSGSELYRTVYADAASTRQSSTRLLASNVTALTFTYNNADFAQVTEIDTSITLFKTLGREDGSLTLTSKSRLRN